MAISGSSGIERIFRGFKKAFASTFPHVLAPVIMIEERSHGRRPSRKDPDASFASPETCLASKPVRAGWIRTPVDRAADCLRRLQDFIEFACVAPDRSIDSRLSLSI